MWEVPPQASLPGALCKRATALAAFYLWDASVDPFWDEETDNTDYSELSDIDEEEFKGIIPFQENIEFNVTSCEMVKKMECAQPEPIYSSQGIP